MIPGRSLHAALGLAVLLTTATAAARVELDSPYTKAQSYSGALRYLRVDLDYEVLERDPDAAYLLFRFVPDGKGDPIRGSIEVIEVEGETRIIFQLPALPSYREALLRDGLASKLRGEYGEPPARPRPPPPSEDGSEAERDKNDGNGGDGSRPSETEEGRDGVAERAPESRQDGRRRSKKPRR